MAVDITVKILKRDRATNNWNQVFLHKKENNNFSVINPYPSRNYELFDILDGTRDIYNYQIPAIPIQYEILPNNLKEEIKEAKEWGYNFREINLADLKYYLSIIEKQYRDIEAKKKIEDDEDNFNTIINSLKDFIIRIQNYVLLSEDPDTYFYSDIKILFWFDR